MTTQRMPSFRSHFHLEYLIYDAVGRQALHPHALRGSVLERRFSNANVSEMAHVNERLATLPNVSIHRIHVCMSRLHTDYMTNYNAMYEKVLLVATDGYMTFLPRPRPYLACFYSITTSNKHQYVHARCKPLKESEHVHLDFHTRFHHCDTPVICVASLYQALLTYACQENCNFTGSRVRVRRYVPTGVNFVAAATACDIGCGVPFGSVQ